ncbi:hypothetical protein H257_18890 [Aphanomyces astaci]|uniref:Uncharacterized protein n=1 Tax=Aphanomyces astaci TaxID=112090 RepID=W4F9L9_APHAT|nr:hypothetical protein H257_18890 [Aphanomyces astaci]ETV64185.1 hypothetical protein H257_18890 [Aphanomyces astaci]|eukprot:XP_009846330.1 hypothetical protein H257_18890 [Aphanomyces astaci]
MPRGKNNTDVEKGQVKAYLDVNKSLHWIARAIGCSKKLVRTYVASLKRPTELIEENRVLRAEMQAATFMIPLVGQPETPSEPRAAVEPKFSANYTDQMIVALLEVRFGWFRDDFAGSKSNTQLACLWEKVALQFNIITSASVRIPSTSLKNKLEFGTENPSSLWDVNNGSGVEDGDGDLHVDDAERKRKRIVAGEVDRQRQLRKLGKTDVGAGLVSLGAALAQGMPNLLPSKKKLRSHCNGVMSFKSNF